MDYNKNYKYNYTIATGGGKYNSSAVSVLLSFSELFSSFDQRSPIISKNILYENPTFTDFFAQYVFNYETEEFSSFDGFEHSALFDIMEHENVTDEFSDLIVALYILDKNNIIDEFRKLDVILNQDDGFESKDDITLESLLKLAEKYSLDEARNVIAFLQKHDSFGATDRSPRTALSDFVVGHVDNHDTAYDWIIPFEMKVDWKGSTIQVMPQTESDYIDLPNVDGSMIANTIYKNRIFNIVAFSELGLTKTQKEELKTKIVQVLDSTKNTTKKLTFHPSDVSFDVKYSGAANIVEGPSYVKATIPLESSPYGHKLFETVVDGSGLIVNDGDEKTGCLHEISSGCVNPGFLLGEVSYSWNGTVPYGFTLIIDHNDYSCYLRDNLGNRTNAIDKLSGEFQSIPKHSSIAITANDNTRSYIKTYIKEKILWIGGSNYD